MMTSDRVAKESIAATIERGRQSSHKRKIWLFAYCWEWVSDTVKKALQKEDGPVVILQATSSFGDSAFQFSCCGPGLFIARRPQEWKICLRRAERFRTNAPVLYTENLLQQRGYRVESYSEYLTYYRTMKPMGEIDMRDGVLFLANTREWSMLPWLATTLESLHKIHIRYPEDSIYFAPIGEFYTGVRWVHDTQEMRNGEYVLPIRRILRVLRSSPLVDVARQYPHYELGESVLFFCSLPSTPLLSTHQGHVDLKGTAKIRVSFRDDVHTWSFVYASEAYIHVTNGMHIHAAPKESLRTKAHLIRFLAEWQSRSDQEMEERIVRDVLRELSIEAADSFLFDQGLFKAIQWSRASQVHEMLEEKDCGQICPLCQKPHDYEKGGVVEPGIT